MLPFAASFLCKELDTRPTVPPRNPVIEVVINVPSIKIVEIGEDFRADCTAHHVVSQVRCPLSLSDTDANRKLSPIIPLPQSPIDVQYAM